MTGFPAWDECVVPAAREGPSILRAMTGLAFVDLATKAAIVRGAEGPDGGVGATTAAWSDPDRRGEPVRALLHRACPDDSVEKIALDSRTPDIGPAQCVRFGRVQASAGGSAAG